MNTPSAKPYFGNVHGRRYVPSWDVRTAPIERVTEKYADKPVKRS